MYNLIEFKYRKYWTRVFVGIFFILLMYIIKDVLLSNITNDGQYILASLTITILLIFIYYKMTIEYFLWKGKYIFNDNNIEVYLSDKLKIVNLDKIKEVSYMRRSIFGEEFILLTIVQHGEKTIKIMSENIDKDYDIISSPLYKLYRFVEYNSQNLKNASYNNSDCLVLERSSK